MKEHNYSPTECTKHRGSTEALHNNNNKNTTLVSEHHFPATENGVIEPGSRFFFNQKINTVRATYVVRK